MTLPDRLVDAAIAQGHQDPWLTVHVGDCRDVLATLPEASVHCVVTSPPYWGLRDYGTASWDGGDPSCDHQVGTFDAKRGDRERYSGHDKRPGRECGKCGAVRQDRQLGLEATPEDYVANMVAVFREVRRVLRDDGTLWLNLGDSYSGYHGNSRVSDMDAPSNKPGYVENMRTSTVGISGLKPKDLVGIPWMVAKTLQAPYYTGRIKSEADRAWLAGWLDGEGTISYVERDRGPDHTPTHDVRVFITNTDRGPLDYFAAMTAGRVYQHEDGRRENRHGDRACFRWQMGTHDAALLLRELYPYLRTKRRQAALVWTLYTTLRHKNGHARTPDAVVARRRDIASMVRTLNAGGDVTLPSWVEEPPSATEPGWYLRSDVIWSKPNPMPESVTDRPTKAHEYLFLLTKAPRYFYDADAVREALEHPNRTGTNPRLAVDNTGLGAHGSAKKGGIDSNPAGRNRRSVWTVATQPYPGAHFAVMPEALVEPCILAGTSERGVCPTCGSPWERVVDRTDDSDLRSHGTHPGGKHLQGPASRLNSGTAEQYHANRAKSVTTGWRATCAHDAEPVGAVVLDPFGGSGTVAVVAQRHRRRAVLIELNPEYADQSVVRASRSWGKGGRVRRGAKPPPDGSWVVEPAS